MDLSLLFQICGSISVLIGYYLNSKNNPRQHMAFIFGHLFLIGFTTLESKWVLLGLSILIIYFQYKISLKKMKFKKDLIRVKKIARAPKNIYYKVTDYQKSIKS